MIRLDKRRTIITVLPSLLLFTILLVINSDNYLNYTMYQVNASTNESTWITVAHRNHETKDNTFNFGKARIEQSKRIATIEKACDLVQEEIFRNSVKGNLRYLKIRHFLINHEHRILYCWIHKSASTSWIAFFTHLGNRSHVDPIIYYREIPRLSAQTPGELATASRSYFKFLVVRHPLDRILSAYRDRIMDNSRYSYAAWEIVPRIFRMLNPQFNGSLHNHLFYRNKTLKVIPSFRQFVKYLLHTQPQKYDVHWKPYWIHCSLCIMKYDAVIKLETADRDELYVVHQLGEDSSVAVKHMHSTGGGSSTELRKKFFSTITCTELLGLHKKYYFDFLLFDYSLADFEGICKRDLSNSTIYL